MLEIELLMLYEVDQFLRHLITANESKSFQKSKSESVDPKRRYQVAPNQFNQFNNNNHLTLFNNVDEISSAGTSTIYNRRKKRKKTPNYLFEEL
jgi:hypothetical protein